MNILIEKNIMIPMRDGVKLATDVYRPVEDRQYPVIIQRLPSQLHRFRQPRPQQNRSFH
jgi:predicted acyl esterase